VGFPDIIRHDFDSDFSVYFGIAKVKILCPYEIFIPILPQRYNGRLVFGCCKQCIIDEEIDCSHNDEHRSFIGTYTMAEINLALEYGYKILGEIFVFLYRDLM
jgi:hypothetical protein